MRGHLFNKLNTIFMSNLTQDIILVLIVIAGILSFFFNPLGENMEYIRLTMGVVVGFLLKNPIEEKELPIVRAFKKD